MSTKRDLFATGFVADDFSPRFHPEACKQAALIANALLEQAKRDSVRVYGGLETANGRRKWDVRKKPDDTHQALLIAVEEIKSGNI